MMADLAVTGRDAGTELRIVNTHVTPLAVEIEFVERTIDSIGVETQRVGADEVVAFPPQAFILPGATQVVRLRYAGEPGIETARNYTALVRQVPVSLDGQSGISIAVNYGVLVNVVPANARARVEVLSVRRTEDGKAEIFLRNSGDNYASLARARYEFRNGRGETHAAEGRELVAAIGNTLLQARSERILTLPLPEGFADDGLSLRVVSEETARP